MAYTTAERFLYLKTQLGDDKLLLKSFQGHEGLNQLFDFQLEFQAESATEIDFDKLIGQKVNFGVLGVEDRLKPRHFQGIVVELAQAERGRVFTTYRMRVAPELWMLTRKFQSRIFQHLSVPDILKKVLAGLDVAYELQGTFEPRDYCTQYRETDFEFFSRLVEEEGIYYFFKFTAAKHQLVLANTRPSHPDITGDANLIYDTDEGGGRDEERITGWTKEQYWGSGKYTLWDHHFQRAHQKLEAAETIMSSVQVGKVQHKLKVGGNEQLEVYDYPGEYAKRFDGIEKGGGENAGELGKISQDNKRTVGIRMQQTETPMLLIRGVSNCRQATPGHKFNLQRHFNGEGQYVFTEVFHAAVEGGYRSDGEADAEETHYENHFSCIPYELPFRPVRSTRRPVIPGPQTAVVVGPQGEEIFTDKYGRIKVQFHWDRQGKYDVDSSCWVRVGTVWAGKRWGAIHIPRVGHEVVVAFLEGDPDRPLVVGSVYNSDTMPPYDLPANKTRSGIKTNSTPGSGGFNEIRFEDKKDNEQIFIHAQKNEDIRVEKDCKEWIGQDRHLIVKRDKYEETDFDCHVDTHRDHMEKIGRNRSVTVATDESIKVDGTQSVKVTGNVAHQFGANHSEQTTGMYYLHAQNIVLMADTAISLNVGGNLITITAAGINVMGMPMVNINSGGAAIPGVPGMLVPPTAPGAAQEADKAVAGSEVRYNASGASATPYSPPPPPPPPGPPRHNPNSEEAKKKPHYIAIELHDDEHLPVAGEPYEIVLTDGTTVASGVTDAQGRARVDGIDPGQCRVRFPRRDQTAIKRR